MIPFPVLNTQGDHASNVDLHLGQVDDDVGVKNRLENRCLLENLRIRNVHFDHIGFVEIDDLVGAAESRRLLPSRDRERGLGAAHMHAQRGIIANPDFSKPQYSLM